MSEKRKELAAAAARLTAAQKAVKKEDRATTRALASLKKQIPGSPEYATCRKEYYAAKQLLKDARETLAEVQTAYDHAVENIRTIRRFFPAKRAPEAGGGGGARKKAAPERKVSDDGTRVALTWGDAGENHVGMQVIGEKQAAGTGFTVADLQNIAAAFEETDVVCELVRLDQYTDVKAGVLVIRGLLKGKFLTELKKELTLLDWDAKYYDRRRSKVLNKRARVNLMFQHGVSAEPCYEEGRGRVVDIDSLPLLHEAEKLLHAFPSKVMGKRWIPLVCEGNYYYDAKKTGIGFHGDTERTRVICLSVGAHNYPMRWQCFCRGKVVGEPVEVFLNSGDAYIMSEKAVGNDWKKRTINTLRHAAGAKKYIGIQKSWLPSPDDVQKEPVRLERK